MPAPPIGGALCAAAPGLLWPACAVLAGVAVPAVRRLRGPVREEAPAPAPERQAQPG
ncbi:hypothetical protein [Streptomyces atratus]|uniref:hypothetical protein n=1 Tax=Streptomyces atratus TaxID=1893 RepID=UPI00364E92FB